MRVSHPQLLFALAMLTTGCPATPPVTAGGAGAPGATGTTVAALPPGAGLGGGLSRRSGAFNAPESVTTQATKPSSTVAAAGAKAALAAALPSGTSESTVNRILQGVAAQKPEGTVRLQTVGVDARGQIHPDPGVDVVTVKTSDTSTTNVVLSAQNRVVVFDGKGRVKVTLAPSQAAAYGLQDAAATPADVTVCINVTGQIPKPFVGSGDAPPTRQALLASETTLQTGQALYSLGGALDVTLPDGTTPTLVDLPADGTSTVHAGFGPYVIVTHGGQDKIVGPAPNDSTGTACRDFSALQRPVVVAQLAARSSAHIVLDPALPPLPYDVDRLVDLYTAGSPSNAESITGGTTHDLTLANIQTLSLWTPGRAQADGPQNLRIQLDDQGPSSLQWMALDALRKFTFANNHVADTGSFVAASAAQRYRDLLYASQTTDPGMADRLAGVAVPFGLTKAGDAASLAGFDIADTWSNMFKPSAAYGTPQALQELPDLAQQRQKVEGDLKSHDGYYQTLTSGDKLTAADPLAGVASATADHPAGLAMLRAVWPNQADAAHPADPFPVAYVLPAHGQVSWPGPTAPAAADSPVITSVVGDYSGGSDFRAIYDWEPGAPLVADNLLPAYFHIAGRNLAPADGFDPVVMVNGRRAQVTEFDNKNILANVPPLADGRVADVTVTIGARSVTQSKALSFKKAPTITAVSKVKTSGGWDVIVTGMDLDHLRSASVIYSSEYANAQIRKSDYFTLLDEVADPGGYSFPGLNDWHSSTPVFETSDTKLTFHFQSDSVAGILFIFWHTMGAELYIPIPAGQ